MCMHMLLLGVRCPLPPPAIALPRCRRPRSLCLAAATRQRNSPRSATPPACLQSELAVVERAPTSESYARVDFHPECEAAINEQINIE